MCLIQIFMKYLFVLLLPFLLACNLKQNSESKKETDIKLPESDTIDVSDDDYVFDESYYKDFAYKDIKIFESRAYINEPSIEELFNIMDTITGLFYSNNVYNFKYCKIIKTNVFENECGVDPFIAPTLNVKDSCLYLFRGLNNLKKSVLARVSINLPVRLWPGQITKFTFNNTVYELRAEGKVLRSSGIGDALWQDVRNYKLYLTVAHKSQCIVEMKYFNETMTEIRWIGDLDGDSKPDFIVSSPDHYETSRIMLFLSSLAEEGEIVKLVSVKVDSSNC